MGEGLKQMLSSSYRAEDEDDDDDELGETSSQSDDDVVANGEEEYEYASSSSLPPNNSDRSLDEMSSLLPLKRGLSKYYQGKSQSFSSFSDVGSVGDLAKKETPYKRKTIKTCRSCAGGLDEHKYGPLSAGDHYNKSITTILPKKASTNSTRNGACAPLIARTSSTSTSTLFSSGHGKPPLIPNI